MNLEMLLFALVLAIVIRYMVMYHKAINADLNC